MPSLKPEDEARRDAWLKECTNKPFKAMVYCGREVTIADVERWLRDALGTEVLGIQK